MSLRAVTALSLLVLTLAGCAGGAKLARPADLTEVTVVEAARLTRQRSVASAELTEAFLARAEANPDLNAFITLDRAGAMAAAQKADEALGAGKSRGRLHGVPLVVKDNTHVAGLPNTAGTPALRAFVPKDNAPTVAGVGGGGAVILEPHTIHAR